MGAVIGPVMKSDAQVAQAGNQLFQALPPKARLLVLAVALLIGMAGCSAAWLDYKQDYRPSPNYCRAEQEKYAARLGCVVPQRVPAEVQR
ncbi:hypothetical protein AB0H49_34005 [Nocardia sp. NPDC050713]|uniref:hypothetical protein n=1 Tax=Nocardia sp. NPDC050713 TaxID=3154511 RepID=UPI003405512A